MSASDGEGPRARRWRLLVATALGLLAWALSAGTALADGRPGGGSVATGGNHACAVFPDGKVKCWGTNSHGQLGLGVPGNRGATPGEMGDALPSVDLGTGRTATQIAAGAHHTCALLDDATVKCWGGNDSGQLGLGDRGDRGQASGEMGDDLPTVDLGSRRTATAIVAGRTHTCALLDDATIKCWGDNADGQLGLGDRAARGDEPGEMGDNLRAVDLGGRGGVAQIAAGVYHTCALLDDGTAKCWGGNGSGQLGLGDADPRGGSSGEMGDHLRAIDLGSARTATAITAGLYHSCAVLDDATAKCWGDNAYGQLGLGDSDHRGDNPGEMGDSLPTVALGTGRTATQLAAGSHHTCALLDDAAVKCWGQEIFGHLGGSANHLGDEPGEMGDDLPAIDLGRQTVAIIAAGAWHTCALRDDGTVRCWGSNLHGKLGLGDNFDRGATPSELGDDLPAVDLGSGRTATHIATGAHHTCALLDDASVKCWGGNSSGELGLGDSTHRGTGPGQMGDALPAVDLGSGRTATHIATGNSHVCAILDDATIKCWGDNEYGQLGLGDTDDRGERPGEMGDALTAVDLGSGRTATQITAGGWHTCALLDDATTKCWGSNSDGQLGLGDTVDRGIRPGQMGDSLPALDFGNGRTATALTAGYWHTCALLDDATAKCWGNNGAGQLGLGDTLPRGTRPDQMSDALPTIDLGSGRTATALTAGHWHACALLDNATTRCWGRNDHGQLGLGDTVPRGTGPGEMGDALPAVDLGSGRTATQFTGGTLHTCALLDDATTKCWGDNSVSQLGLGDRDTRGGDPGEMGDDLPAVDLGMLRLRDGIVPTVRASLVPTRWVPAPLPVTLTARDLGGSGLAAVRYAIVAAGDATPDPLEPSGAPYSDSAPPELADGERLVFAARDRAGNRTIVHATAAARVDTTLPQTTDDVPAGPAEQHVVTLTATDAQSGVAETRYTVGTAPGDPYGSDGLTYDPAAKPIIRAGERIRYGSIDAVGNRETARISAALAAPPAPRPPAPRPPAPAANIAPTANAIVTHLGRRGRGKQAIHRYRLDATASIDPDGTIVRWRWRLDGRQIAQTARATVRIPAGSRPRRITLTVTDDRGGTATTAVTVRAPLPPPVRVTIPASIAFATDSATLSSRARAVIKRLRPHLRGALRLRVVGHSDSRGPADYNRALSRRRAQTVAQALLTGVKPRPRRITVAGRGAATPIASNTTATGRAINRRVEITIITRR